MYTPEPGKPTINTVLDLPDKPFRQIPKIRLKPMSPSYRKYVQDMITLPAFRRQERLKDRIYNHSGQRQILKDRKTPEEIALSKQNSKRRRALRDAVCKKYFPKQYDAWKHGTD